ncbi:MAG: tyrosinase family protein [Candidatus Kapaibacterium sp.]
MESNGQSSDLRIRKNLLDLADSEVSDLRQAFTLLNESREYQKFASILVHLGHTQQNDLLFLPWARAYFYEFELLLQSVVPSVTLPYWDYTSETSRKDGLPPVVATPVTESGELNPLFRGEWREPLHTFRETMPPIALAETATLAETAMSFDDFVTFSTSIWKTDIFTHIWLGGSSRSTATTAFDPIFWFSHCNLDRLWDEWQRKYDDYSAPASVESADLKPFRIDDNGSSRSLTGADVLRTAELGYTYV